MDICRFSPMKSNTTAIESTPRSYLHGVHRPVFSRNFLRAFVFSGSDSAINILIFPYNIPRAFIVFKSISLICICILTLINNIQIKKFSVIFAAEPASPILILFAFRIFQFFGQVEISGNAAAVFRRAVRAPRLCSADKKLQLQA